jgi:shikimate dehydrogenase
MINCTPLGMWPETEATPTDIEDIIEIGILADTIYNPLETEWLQRGRAEGAKIIRGMDMFIAQGLASADIWFGEKISKKIDLEPIKKVLKSELC